MKDIRNIAIIAHVDHGKTTLVDGMLKQTHTFRENQAEMKATTILDSNELERERGITILAKNTAVWYREVKINIIDTPGHADFGGEVERVLNMADGALLVVDAAEGPLPQTKFVLQKALLAGLKIILVINKIDKKDARPKEVLAETEELFLRLASSSKHLDFPVIYAVGRTGKAWRELPETYTADTPGDLGPLFDVILENIPNAAAAVPGPLQMQISTLDYDQHLGRLGVGRIKRGGLKSGDRVALADTEKVIGFFNVQKMYTSKGIIREAVNEAETGDIAAIAGIPNLAIGLTICQPDQVEALPQIVVEEPTLKITIGANTSPLAGREGKFVTSRQIGERLAREGESNLGMRFTDVGNGLYEVAGRGELHLAIIIETMRREGYEMQISQPKVIIKNGQEPYEEVTIDATAEYIGAVTSEMGQRKAEMQDMESLANGDCRISYRLPQRNMLGGRNALLTATRGTAVINTISAGYHSQGPEAGKIRNGAMVASESGKASSYSLENAQERGILFIDPGDEVYEGMVVGLSNRENDLEINVVKEKVQTNFRMSNKEIKPPLTPGVKMSLEQALDFIEEDELLEITPGNLRVRKQLLAKLDRVRQSRRTRHEQPVSG